MQWVSGVGKGIHATAAWIAVSGPVLLQDPAVTFLRFSLRLGSGMFDIRVIHFR
jgi:hypothetical protein